MPVPDIAQRVRRNLRYVSTGHGVGRTAQHVAASQQHVTDTGDAAARCAAHRIPLSRSTARCLSTAQRLAPYSRLLYLSLGCLALWYRDTRSQYRTPRNTIRDPSTGRARGVMGHVTCSRRAARRKALHPLRPWRSLRSEEPNTDLVVPRPWVSTGITSVSTGTPGQYWGPGLVLGDTGCVELGSPRYRLGTGIVGNTE
eukprot:718927-Rhodomonas_salina.5